MSKRDATPWEAEEALLAQHESWNRCNPSIPIPLSEWREKQDEALEQGYKDEMCEKCGSTWCAFMHFVHCSRKDCPLVEGKGTLLERLTQAINNK